MIKKKRINSMKYETEACVYCEASASLLAKKIKNLDIYTVIKDLNFLKNVFTKEKPIFPKRLTSNIRSGFSFTKHFSPSNKIPRKF